MIGNIISHYRILEKLGGGGMGIVYKALDLKLERYIALKFLPHHLSVDETEKQRFILEAKSASALDHPNICTIHEINETEEGQLFIALAYYQGATLKKKIERGPMNLEDALDIAIQIVLGLNKAHQNRIIHRDIKPANVVITNDGMVKIVDFGLAKLAGHSKLTKKGSTLGTIAYMSPEQARGKGVDHRTDIWSLGVVLYEMITGELPFKGDYDQAVIYSIMNEDPASIAGLRSEVPVELERFVNKCLAKAPEERYQHADELAANLQRVIQELGSSKKYPVIKLKQHRLSHDRIRRRFFSFGIFLAIIMLITVVYFLSDRIPSKDKSENMTHRQSEWVNSIAVLPFKNISPDLEQEYFCEGMTEQIITNLSRLQRLKVIARTSVMKFKDSKKTIPEIGRELNVSHILEGSIRKFGNMIRVTVQLINTDGGYHLWAKDYNREYKNIFGIQDDVSQDIANILFERISPEEIDIMRRKKPANFEAYKNFLKGKFFHKKFYHTFQLEDFKTAELFFKKTIKLDPEYAPSYAELANLYNTYEGYVAKTKEDSLKYFRLQEKYIEQAVRLDSNSPDVLYIQALVFWSKRATNKRFDCLKKALQINPNHTRSNFQMGVFLRNLGVVKPSFFYFNKAIQLDPLDSWHYGARSLAYQYTGEYEKAALDIDSALQIEPEDKLILLLNIELFIILRKLEKAEKLLSRIEKLYPDDEQFKVHKAWLLVVKGEKESALKQFEESNGGRSDKIILYSLMGLKDETFELMKALQNEDVQRSRYLRYKNLRWYDSLRTDNRFKEIMTTEKERYERLLKQYGNMNKYHVF